MRVLHLADLHLGVENYGRLDPNKGISSRVVDFLRCLDFAAERAAAVDLVVIAGDVYKTCTPSPTLQREFAQRVRQMSRSAPVFLITGNHDVPNAAERATSVDIFSALEVEGVTVERLRGLHTIETRAGRVQIAAQPFLPESRLKAEEDFKGLTIEESRAKMEEMLCRSIDRMAEQRDLSLPGILLVHYTVRGTVLGGYAGRALLMPEIQLPLSTVTNPAFDYVALGHIHKHQCLNPRQQPPVVYPGSIERVDFSEEEEEKGFVLANVIRGATTWEFVPAPARRFITLRVDADADDPTEKMLAALSGRESAGAPPVADAVVRVLYTLPEGRPPIREAEVRQALEAAAFIAGIRREVPRREARERNVRLTGLLPPLEALREYLQTRPDLQPREEELLSYAKPLIAEVTDGMKG
jgi:DNA repair protein SbcD/Mre11